ncbi:putative metallocarboxypeptidase, peptidase M14 family [Campylobacter iguaniorum]|uniref:Putative metallocarboxypeptidase, peptidase M14 family n=1 Tax=Campylobacter iguaniorum TaxID=1244531 RepID=A0A076F9C0_9BACT|nr:putative metallocarboxypeptidase, peptidase M14 family [Campylobacter iguaniorum]ALV23836.1 putative metallocarboxypeptidase, peptidase M14 family [Campylobacter iguaniorum]
MELDLNRGMYKLFKVLLIGVFCVNLYANDLTYSFIKKGVDDNNTVLLIGGIQGDEPGGFLAASLVATEYNVTKGSLWVVPNLNFDSIIKNDRGAFGDMNRKFASISPDDPDIKSVNGIKKLLLDQNVSMVIHLHDGSGFYRPTYINEMKNPRRWGNSAIIDQEKLEFPSPYSNLKAIATQVIEKVNQNAIDDEHKYYLRNTNTALGDKEMLKSLTYFAITNAKPAFANEASKSLASHERVYYHLLAIEEYLKIAGIEFQRGFELNPKSIKKEIEKEIEIVLFNNKFYLSLNNPRAKIGYVPIPKDTALEYNCTSPLAALIKDKNGYTVHYGNKILTKLVPEFIDYSNLTSSIEIEVDDKKEQIELGSKIEVSSYIKVLKKDKIRVNVIGYGSKPVDESNIKISKKDIKKSFSIDKKGNIFRVELYEQSKDGDKFIGMFLVEFKDGKSS